MVQYGALATYQQDHALRRIEHNRSFDDKTWLTNLIDTLAGQARLSNGVFYFDEVEHLV